MFVFPSFTTPFISHMSLNLLAFWRYFDKFSTLEFFQSENLSQSQRFSSIEAFSRNARYSL